MSYRQWWKVSLSGLNFCFRSLKTFSNKCSLWSSAFIFNRMNSDTRLKEISTSASRWSVSISCEVISEDCSANRPVDHYLLKQRSEVSFPSVFTILCIFKDPSSKNISPRKNWTLPIKKPQDHLNFTKAQSFNSLIQKLGQFQLWLHQAF